MKEVWESLRAEMETQARLFSQLSADIDEQVAKQLAQTRDEQGKQRKNVWFSPAFASLLNVPQVLMAIPLLPPQF